MNAAAPVPAKTKKSKTKFIVIGAILLVAALGGAAYMKNKNADVGQVVTVEKAVVKTITQLVNATGKIQPEVEVKIAPEVSGEIIELPFREGRHRQKG